MVIVSALGYFVDVFDLILFSVVRISSLKDLTLTAEEVTSAGILLINLQMLGMLVGGIFWGVLGDKFGRIKVLFGSILLYSLANFGNAFVYSVESYGAFRFLAGLGLAGEIGAGITLVAEILPQRIRGLGTTLVASIGVLGAVVAGLLGEQFHWRTAYAIGGILGVILLILRVSVHESGMFHEVQASTVRRGDLILLSSPYRLFKYLLCIATGIPAWFIVGILVTLSPEISQALGASTAPGPGLAIVWCYVGFFLGDMCGGLLSQYFESRRKVLMLFGIGALLSTIVFLHTSAPSLSFMYTMFTVLGFFGGAWVLILTNAAEQFGTNLRATVATTVPNFVRGTLVLMNLAFANLKGKFGPVMSAEIVGYTVFVISLLAVWALKETFHKDLRYVEE